MAKRITISLSDELAAAVEQLRKRRKYRTLSEYFVGLARYDGQSQKEHHFTTEWAALTGYERDRLDAAILRQVQSGEGIHHSWLEERIKEIMARHSAAGTTPTPHEVARELAQMLAD